MHPQKPTGKRLPSWHDLYLSQVGFWTYIIVARELLSPTALQERARLAITQQPLYNLGSGSWLAWANDTSFSALCGHPLSALANDWTRGAACRHITPQSATEGICPAARKLLFSAPIHGGTARLSWPGWPVTYRDGLPARRRSPIQVVTQQYTAVESNSRLSVTSSTSYTII